MKKVQDGFFMQAKRDGYFARSAYKLEAIDQKFQLIRPNQAVLDLGSSPGSWLQYLSRKLGPGAKLAGVDITPVKPSIQTFALVLEKSIADCVPGDFARVAERFDVVLSDMAPKTSGIRLADQANSLELAQLALAFACKMLKPKGAFVAKIFESPMVNAFVKETENHFGEVKLFKPPASRSESFETFVVAKKFKG